MYHYGNKEYYENLKIIEEAKKHKTPKKDSALKKYIGSKVDDFIDKAAISQVRNKATELSTDITDSVVGAIQKASSKLPVVKNLIGKSGLSNALNYIKGWL